jgi:hypothetical protein
LIVIFSLSPPFGRGASSRAFVISNHPNNIQWDGYRLVSDVSQACLRVKTRASKARTEGEERPNGLETTLRGARQAVMAAECTLRAIR